MSFCRGGKCGSFRLPLRILLLIFKPSIMETNEGTKGPAPNPPPAELSRERGFLGDIPQPEVSLDRCVPVDIFISTCTASVQDYS